MKNLAKGPTTRGPALSESDRERRYIIGSFALGHMSNDWAAGSIWLIASAVAVSEGLGAPEVGWLLAIHGIGAAMAYIPAGMLADRTAARGPLLLLTFWWVAAGYTLASFAPGFWSLAALLAVAVLGDAAWHPIASGILVQRYPERRAHVLGMHSMGGTLGSEVFAPIAVGVILTFGSWQTALRLSVIPALIMGILFIRVSRRLGSCETIIIGKVPFRELLKPWMTRHGKAFVAAIVLYNMAYMAVVAMTPLFLQQDLDYSPLVAGIVFAVMLTLGSAMQPLVGRLSDAVGRRSVIMAFSTAGAGFAALAGFVTPGLVSVAGLIGVAAVLTSIRSVVLATAAEIAQEREATHLALAFTLMDGVGALGAVIAGYVARNDLPNAFLLAAGLALAAATACRWLPVGSTVPDLSDLNVQAH